MKYFIIPEGTYTGYGIQEGKTLSIVLAESDTSQHRIVEYSDFDGKLNVSLKDNFNRDNYTALKTMLMCKN